MVHSRPLTVEAIDAAKRLYKFVGEEPDNTLKFLAARLPGFGPEETLLKVVAVNSLYSTNVYAVRQMADHVQKVMCCVRADSDPAEVVKQISTLSLREGEKGRRFISFGSKFAHFFIDQERFAIYDSYAIWMIQYHLGTRNCVTSDDHPYQAFLQNLQRLCNQCGFQGCLRDLDGYLWLAGELRTWHKKSDRVNAEMKKLFDHPPEDARSDLRLLASMISVDGCF